MANDKTGRSWLDRLFGGATHSERADYEARINGQTPPKRSRPPVQQPRREREHGDGRARG